MKICRLSWVFSGAFCMAEPQGYLIPVDLDPDERVCVLVRVPKDDRHLAAFWGQLSELGYWYTWERDTAKSGASLAQVWRRVYAESHDLFIQTGGACVFCCEEELALLKRLLLCCEGQAAGAQISIISYRQTVYNTYWSAPTTIHYDAPQTTFNSSTGDTPEQAAIRDASLCFAISEYVQAIIQQAQIGLAAAGVGASIVAGFVASPFAAGFVSMLSAAAFLAWDYGVFTDEEAIKKVRCCMRAGLEGQAVTFDNFSLSVLSCGFDDLTAESQLAYLINAANQDRTNFLEFVRLLGVAQTVTATSADPCDCTPPECPDCTPNTWEGIPDAYLTYLGDCWWEVHFQDMGTSWASNGRFYAELQLPGCCKFIESDYMGNIPAPVGNRAYKLCGAGSFSYGSFGQGLCVDGIAFRFYSATPIRVRFGLCD